AGDRLGRRLDKEHPLPWDRNLVEPHLAVEFVVAVAQRGNEGVGVTRPNLAAHGGKSGCGDFDDEARPVAADLHPIEGSYTELLGISRARVHADLATNDDAGIGLANKAQRVALARVFAQAIPDRRGTAAERQKSPSSGKIFAIGPSVRDLRRR